MLAVLSSGDQSCSPRAWHAAAALPWHCLLLRRSTAESADGLLGPVTSVSRGTSVNTGVRRGGAAHLRDRCRSGARCLTSSSGERAYRRPAWPAGPHYQGDRALWRFLVTRHRLRGTTRLALPWVRLPTDRADPFMIGQPTALPTPPHFQSRGTTCQNQR